MTFQMASQFLHYCFFPLKIQIQRIKAQLIPSTTNIQYLKEAPLRRFILANNLKYTFFRGVKFLDQKFSDKLFFARKE